MIEQQNGFRLLGDSVMNSIINISDAYPHVLPSVKSIVGEISLYHILSIIEFYKCKQHNADLAERSKGK